MKTKIKNSVLILITFICTNAQAQVRTNYYTNLLNPFLVNPAMAGAQDNVSAIFNARTFVGGMSSSSRMINFGLHAATGDNTGLGAKVISEWVGAFQTINAEGAYSKMIQLNTDHSLTFGLSLGFVQTTINQSMINTLVDLNDPTLVSNNLNKIRLTAGTGAVYRFKKKAEVYFSSPMLVTGNQSMSSFFVAGANYRFLLGKAGEYGIKPIMNYYNFSTAPKLVDVLVSADWKETVMLQTGYRTNGTVVGGIGFNFKSIIVSYNYYHHLAELSRLAPAQNEIAIALNFAKIEKKIKRKNEAVTGEVIQDKIDNVNDRINGLINIEKTNPGLVNVKQEMVKLNRELDKILSKYKIDNIDQLKKIKELQVNLELLISTYNDK